MKEKAEKLISQRNQQSKDQQGKKKVTSVGAKCTSGYGKEREDSNRQGKAKSGRDKNISGVKDGDKTKERMKGIPKDKKDKSKASIEKTKKTSTNPNASDKVKPVTILLKVSKQYMLIFADAMLLIMLSEIVATRDCRSATSKWG
jgi:hypothetical protein